MFIGSLTRLLLRLVAYLAVCTGLIETQAAEFLVNDPDIGLVVSGAVSFVVVELGRILAKRYGLSKFFRKVRDAYRTAP